MVCTLRTLKGFLSPGAHMRSILLALVVGLTMLLCGAQQANAGEITYTESVTATGSIGATAFSDTLVTFTFVGDTANVFVPFPSTFPGLFLNSVGTGTVTIGNLGTFSTNGIAVFDNHAFDSQGDGVAGIAEGVLGPVLLDTYNSAFITYSLTTAIGPITSRPVDNQGFLIPTTGGTLFVSGDVASVSTFSATTAAPASMLEPSSLLLIGMGLVALAGFKAKRNFFGGNREQGGSVLAQASTL